MLAQVPVRAGRGEMCLEAWMYPGDRVCSMQQPSTSGLKTWEIPCCVKQTCKIAVQKDRGWDPKGRGGIALTLAGAEGTNRHSTPQHTQPPVLAGISIPVT